MARLYSCKAASRRWPMHVFYNVLDMSLINAWIVYKEVCQSSISRRCFIQQVASELTGHKPLEEVEHGSDDVIEDEPEPRERKTCRARNCNKNRTTDQCAKCQKPVCVASAPSKPVLHAKELTRNDLCLWQLVCVK